MPKTDIKKIVDASKKLVDTESTNFTESLKSDLESFKKKALK